MRWYVQNTRKYQISKGPPNPLPILVNSCILTYPQRTDYEPLLVNKEIKKIFTLLLTSLICWSYTANSDSKSVMSWYVQNTRKCQISKGPPNPLPILVNSCILTYPQRTDYEPLLVKTKYEKSLPFTLLSILNFFCPS